MRQSLKPSTISFLYNTRVVPADAGSTFDAGQEVDPDGSCMQVVSAML